MKQSIAFATVLMAVFLAVATAQALAPPEVAVSITQIPARSVYGGEPDLLALDFTVVAGDPDVLDVLFVKQEGTAQWERDLTAAELWADDGAVGFQGIGVDRKIASGAWVGSENGWVFTRIGEVLGAGAERFFVTVDVYHFPTNNVTVRLTIPAYRDGFHRMEYDTGDHGIFVRTARATPVATLENIHAHTIIRPTADAFPPVAVIVEPKHGSTLAQDWLLIRGVAQDVGGSAPMNVKVGVNRVGKAITWVSAVPEVAGFATWEARLFGLPRGETLELRVWAEDWNGNRSAVSSPMTVTLTE